MGDFIENVVRRIIEYHKDKELAEKCGLTVQDICVHEFVNNMCRKCGVYYDANI